MRTPKTTASTDPRAPRSRRLVTSMVALLALACTAAGISSCASDANEGSAKDTSTSTTAPTTTDLEPGSKHELIDQDGRFAFAAPRMAKQIAITDDGDGDGAKLRIEVAYDVANTADAKGVAADRSEVTLWIARSMMSMGPQPNDQVHTETKEDTTLDSPSATKDYEFDLPADVKQFLDRKGLASTDEDERAKALELVNVSVQQYRDLQVVDGKADWIHGSTFTGVQGPTKTADRPGGALTVRNDTATGIYTYDSAELEPPAQEFGVGLYPDVDFWTQASPTSTGVPIALSGQSGSCFYQGTDNSNPAGFNTTLEPNMAVTQTIVANDMTDNKPFNQTEAASIADATEDVLKAGVTALNLALSVVFGGPFTLVIALATNLIDVSQYCNNQPNLMQLSAVVGSTGEGSNSTMWDIYAGGGFANVYSSPLRDSAPDLDATMTTDAVQLAPDSANTYEGQPLWLAQVPIEGCGLSDASDSYESGCTSQNLISLRWSQEMPCPFNNGLQPAQGNVVGGPSYCYQPAPESPEIPACGTNNAECVSYNPDE